MRIILADDHGLIRDSLRPYLEQLADNVEIAEAVSLSEVRNHAGFAPDLILLDLQMPGMQGPSSVADVQRVFADVPIVVVSGLSDPAVIRAVLQHGARGYIPKASRGKALVSALKLVLAGERYLPPSLLDEISALPLVSPPNSAGGADGGFEKLSEREATALRLLIRGLSNKEIARELNLQEVTIKVHLRNVYRKIKANSRTDAVRIAMSRGWH